MLVGFTVAEAKELFGGNEGRQIFDYLSRQGYAQREYCSAGEWKSQPGNGVTGLRYKVNGKNTEIRDAATIWKYIKARSIQTPAKPDKILEQLVDVKLKGEELVLFSPWGPRYKSSTAKIKPSDKEIATLEEVGEILDEFNNRGYSVTLFLLAADVYGTEIDGLPGQFVLDYFSEVEEKAEGILDGKGRLIVKLLSAFREEQSELYEQWRGEFDKNFSTWVKQEVYSSTVRIARVFNPKKAEESARRYCIERLTEAYLIQTMYDPIKLSLDRKEQGALDGDLKRAYIVRNKAPWLEEGVTK